MALVCVACHLLPVVFAHLFFKMCFMLAILQNGSSLLTYDHKTLLDIKTLLKTYTMSSVVHILFLFLWRLYLTICVTCLEVLRPSSSFFWCLNPISCFMLAFTYMWQVAAVWHSLEPLHVWNTLIVGDPLDQLPKSCSSHLRRGGVCFSHLCLLCQASQQTIESWQIRVSLINARSVVNKTVILNDFLTSHSLDYLFITET